MNRFATAIIWRFASLDPSVVLQAVEQTGQRRFFDPHPLRNLFLGKIISALGKMDERAPLPLAQAKGTQTLVKLRPPGARGAEEHESELVNVGTRHIREIG
jgi:hypothetical protein